MNDGRGRPGVPPIVRALRRRRRLRASIVQAAYLVVGVSLGVTLPTLDLSPMADSGRVVQLLAGISGGLLTLISIVFSLLFLVVQFASTSLSPRIVLFGHNPLVWHAFGLFAGVLAFSLSAAVTSGQHGSVPVLVPVMAGLLTLVCLVLSRQLQLSAFASVQLAHVLGEVGARGRQVIDALYPDPVGDVQVVPIEMPSPAGQEIRWSGRQGLLCQVDMPRLLSFCQARDVKVALRLVPGDLVREGAVIMSVEQNHPVLTSRDARELLKLVEVAAERSFDQDPRFAFRLLADVGLRALSPAVNDPATAVQSLDAIEALLRVLASRELDVSEIRDEAGRVRVVLPVIGWGVFVADAVDEIAACVGTFDSVRGRIVLLLRETLAAAPEWRHGPLFQRLADLTPGDARM